MKSNKRSTAGLAGPDDPTRSEPDASRLDLNKLRTFAVIADAGGVSAAASRLALSRSAVSHSLAGIEAELGLPLFHRVGKRMVLTQDGKRLRAAYREAEDRIADALSSIGDATREVRGELRVGLYPGFSRFRLARLLGSLLEAHPGARCRLVHGPRQDLLDDLLAGRLDFVLTLGPATREARGRTDARPVFEQTLVLACHADLRRQLGRSAGGLEGISRLPFVDYFRSEPLFARWVAHHFGRRKIARPRVRAWVGSGTDVALELARRGVGACVLPLDLVEPFRRRRAGGKPKGDDRAALSVLRGTGSALRDEIWLHELTPGRPDALRGAFRQVLL
jgi:DNA-binding transcriptional LysR family regulator